MDVRGKRHLPVWMLKGGIPEVIGDEDKKSSSQHRAKGGRTAEEAGEEATGHEARLPDEASQPDVGCEMREKAAVSSLEVVKTSIPQGRKAGAIRKKSSERRAAANSSEVRAQSSHRKPRREKPTSDGTDLDAELTVDDLVSIAEEIVNGGEKKEKTPTGKLASERECLSINEPGSSVQGSRERVEEGGAAKDMLDVFLGPLLRKPVEAKKPAIGLAGGNVEGGGPVLLLPGNSVNGGEERQTVKRKSSLRDRVALYLD